MKFILVLSVLLLFQSITSAPTGKDQLTEREKLEVIVIEEFAKHANLTEQKYRGVFDATIKGIAVKAPVSESMRKKLKQLVDYNTRVDNLPKSIDEKFIDEVFNLPIPAQVIISEHRSEYSKYEDDDDTLIQRELKKNGLETLIADSVNQFAVFEQNVTKRFNEWKALPESERKLNAKVVDWYKKFKSGDVKDAQLSLVLDRIDYGS